MKSESIPQPNEAAESDRLLAFVSAVSDCAIYALTPDGIIRTWNAGAQPFKGYAPKKILGRHFSTVYTAADKQHGLPARVLRIARDNGKFEDEGWRARKDGSHF